MEQKVTLITTVKNEEDSIKSFLDSILEQTRKPDEVIIVDAYSTDKTVEKVLSIEYRVLRIRLIRKKGNRSVGRNAAIKVSSNNIIAVTDGGCILDKYWLEYLVRPFENKSASVVAGYYKPKTRGIFEKCLATYTCIMPDKLNKKNFLPSSRSIAFRKEAWEKVRGYPERLDTCEDLVFDKKLKTAGFKFITQEKAFVWWPQRKNIFQAAKQFYLYAKGDGEARYFRISTPFLFTRYILGIGLLIYVLQSRNLSMFLILVSLFIFYLIWAVFKNYKYVRNWKAFVYLPLLQLVSDIAVLSGTIVGLASNIWDTHGKR